MRQAVGFDSLDPRLPGSMEGLKVAPHGLVVTHYLTG